MTNQFGERLFSIFFKTYTEKVWGMSCKEISRRLGRPAHQGPVAVDGHVERAAQLAAPQAGRGPRTARSSRR